MFYLLLKLYKTGWIKINNPDKSGQVEQLTMKEFFRMHISKVSYKRIRREHNKITIIIFPPINR
jgi:hypothetical protein